jgi:hypothetical protein
MRQCTRKKIRVLPIVIELAAQLGVKLDEGGKGLLDA